MRRNSRLEGRHYDYGRVNNSDRMQKIRMWLILLEKGSTLIYGL